MKFFFYAFIAADFVGFYYLYQFVECVQCTGHTQFYYYVKALTSVIAMALVCIIGAEVESSKKEEINVPEKKLVDKIIEKGNIVHFLVFIFCFVLGGIVFGVQGLSVEKKSMEKEYDTMEKDKWNTGGDLHA